MPASLVMILATALSANQAPAAEQTPRQPPAGHCIDARQVSGVYQPDDNQLLLASAGKHYRLAFSSACPGIASSDALRLRAPQGWVCGGSQDTVVGDNMRCPVSQVELIDSRDYALGARKAQRARPGTEGTLDTVEVTAKAGVDRDKRFARGFVGTTDYCFDPAQMRSWNETPDGLQVMVNPRRNAGNAAYAVELQGNCPMLSSSPSVIFRSGMGLGVICGNAGDRVLAVRDAFNGEAGPAWNNIGARPLAANGPGMTTVATGQCQISAVYPVHS